MTITRYNVWPEHFIWYVFTKDTHNMYVCLCNPFTDKDVKRALTDPGIRNTPAQIYKCCSGGVAPNCGNCICIVKDMIVDHQSRLGVQKIIDDLPAPLPQTVSAE